jgi:hypothetical protein
MKLSRHFSAKHNCKPNGKRPLPWLLGMMLLAVVPAQASSLFAQVIDGVGGKIAVALGDWECLPYCSIETSSEQLVNLFAVPNKGYRFQAWEGDCANTLGPLCTLKMTGSNRLGVRFMKTTSPQKPVKALLLLHGENRRHSVWNEFVKHRFNNRCPVVYGGVILGDDAFDPDNNVYCYRIAFGYYTMLNHGEAGSLANSDDASEDSSEAPFNIANQRLSYEIRAAVLGMLDRHPNSSLTLVGQGLAALGAQTFLQADTIEKKRIIGLLALEPAHTDDAPYNFTETTFLANFKTKRTTVIKLNAAPDQDAKISTALDQLTQLWWTAR